MFRFAAQILLFLACLAAGRVHACPRIDRLVDFNCDGIHKIVITGDSVVAGVGDDPPDYGGYVARLTEDFPYSKITGIGVSGTTSLALFTKYRRYLLRPRFHETKRLVSGADLIIIDVGRNDFWQDILPARTVRNIGRLVRLFENYFKDKDGFAPQIAVTTLLPTTRSYQQEFVTKVDLILLKKRSPHLPVDLRFDLLGTEVLSWDGLHPSDYGYDIIEGVVSGFIRGPLQKKARKLRVNRDKDGVYDFFETLRYHTDPSNPDTDSDGFRDGQEIFDLKTDPLDPKSF